MSAKDLIAGIEAWEKDVLVDGVTEFTKLVATAALVGVVAESPLDTYRFVSNHVVSVRVPSGHSDYDLYDNQALQRGHAAIDAIVTPEIFYIQNNLDYAIPLENGHSGQAPDGVYAPTLQDVSVRFGL